MLHLYKILTKETTLGFDTWSSGQRVTCRKEVGRQSKRHKRSISRESHLHIVHGFRVECHPFQLIVSNLIEPIAIRGRNRYRAKTIRIVVHHECLQKGVGPGFPGVLDVRIRQRTCSRISTQLGGLSAGQTQTNGCVQ
jgi:hypothetical protein